MVVVEKGNNEYSVHKESVSKTTKTALTVQHVLLHQIRRILDDEEFIEILAPVSTLTNDSYKKSLSDMIIYKQTLIRSVEKIYTISPSIKEESQSYSHISRHLYESYQLELEMREKSIHEVIETTELFLERLMEIVGLICSNILEECDRVFSIPSTPFPRITYSELYKLASSLGSSFNFGEAIPSYVKEEISKKVRKPLWIINHPTGSRKGLYREDLNQPGYLATAELIYPEGFGEAASGGERVNDVNKITDYLKSSGEDISEFQLYLDMMETDGRNSAGIAIGIEPLLRYILG
ncbi:MAG: hypothetical protein GOP50_08160 [Candidatus Heimdallarchaeota archaeon]|nr:hypothetical protein [Candidatus Heimdallarchaeota archaeon]